ncbi:MAG: TetR/AcrR family transcriptional regulator [Oscillospiraceae bacterium]
MTRTDRKDAIAALHKENIISAAQELFSEKGFAKTTMDDVAAKAQYSKRTIYTYFESKEEIYNYFLVNGLNYLKDKLGEILDKQSDFIEKYKAICQLLLSIHEEQPSYYEAIINGIKNQNCAENAAAIIDEITLLIINFAKQGQDNGIILQNIDLKKIVLIAFSNITSLLEMSVIKKDYIENDLGNSRFEFLNFGFTLILNSLLDV